MTHDEIEGWFTREPTVASVFICRCSAEGRKNAEKFYAEVKRQLAEDRDIAEVPDNLFLTFVIIDLQCKHYAYISAIHNDQWTAITAETYGDDNPYTVYAQCDNAEDGIAAVWWAYTHRVAVPAEKGEGGGVSVADDGGVLRGRTRQESVHQADIVKLAAHVLLIRAKAEFDSQCRYVNRVDITGNCDTVTLWLRQRGSLRVTSG